MQLLVFRVADARYGIALESVERAVAVVEITPLPKAPEIVRGVVNFQGQIVPAVDLRIRFGLPAREPRLTDRLLLARTAHRAVALMVDDVEGVVECADERISAAQAVVPGAQHVAGVVDLGDGLVLIHDLARCLSLDEERALQEALAHG